MARIQLGDLVRDRLSGYQGIATCRSQYLTGCDRVGVHSRTLKADGGIPDTLWFDEPWVEVLEKSVVSPVEQREADAGGPGHGMTLSHGM